MRSAEPSGVRLKGFDVSPTGLARLRRIAAAAALPIRRCVAGISPVSMAVALTACAAAILSIAADTVRSHEEVRQRQHLVTHATTAGPATEWGDIAATMVTIAGPAVTPPEIDAVWQRSAATFGAAALVIGLTFRRRRRATDTTAGADNPQDLLTAIPFGVACWSREGSLVVCNQNFAARFGAKDRMLRPGASYRETFLRLTQDGVLHLVGESDENRMLELRLPDGSCLLIDERPLAGGGFMTLLTDVTDQRRIDGLLNSIREEQRQLARRYHEEKLRAEAASRSKTSFLAHLSHDIRTPLNHIIGFADMMRQQLYGSLGDARYLEYATAMKESGERLLAFFSSILELAELESGQKPLRSEPQSIDALLQGTLRRHAAQAQQARVVLHGGTGCGGYVLGDQLALERMIGNLVDNAVRFTPAGGRVGVAAFAADGGVVIEISDTGIGISEERLATLSHPFALGDATFSRDHDRAGLGIAISRAIAELSGGRLAIDSSPALGTTVAISLPLAEAPASTSARAA